MSVLCRDEFQNSVNQSISQAVDVELIRISQRSQQLDKNGIKSGNRILVFCPWSVNTMGHCGRFVMRACSHGSFSEATKWNNRKTVT